MLKAQIKRCFEFIACILAFIACILAFPFIYTGIILGWFCTAFKEGFETGKRKFIVIIGE